MRKASVCLPESPAEKRRKELPQGDADWDGYGVVYRRLQAAAQRLAEGKHTYLSDDHVETMAVLGCGHEETMKGWLSLAIDRGWVNPNATH